MEFNKDKVDEMNLALMWLVTQTDKFGSRAWKAFDWATLDRTINNFKIMAFSELELELIDKVVGGLCREMNGGCCG